ncbi:SUMF1/EgtB/PvdO family nonheme iron enzyme [Streptomyces syringium]|uniref:SUMF1/EgtB/PvdO family nonheme iron enzyme n=1 Tax=Streptomyces syringium TaxID=76729 RepID=UPI00342C5CA2
MSVKRWTGKESQLLRLAMRKTVRQFASDIGVSGRMVSRWEAGGIKVVPRPSNQLALDTMLSCAGPEVQERFATSLTEQAAIDADPRTETLLAQEVVYHRHPVDGRLMALVGEGMYLTGETGEAQWLDAFYIDVFPTTNAEYGRFVAATGRSAPKHWGVTGRCPDDLFDHPVVWVTWHDAQAYAEWAGKALPTSQQWEKAARGSKGNIYPWGDRATAAKCNVRDSGIGHTTPVSRYRSGASPYNVYDLCGNTWEWCATRSLPGRYELKGSAYTSPFERAAPSSFNDANAEMCDDDTSFRCVAEHLWSPMNVKP